jgi:pilus assembly protein CpaB
VSPRRRAALLLGLALVLGGLAASDVARREDALRAQLAPLVDVVVAREPLEQGRRLRAADLAVRRIPERFAPPGGAVAAELLVGRRLAVPVVEGAAVNELLLERPQAPPATAVGRGQRAIEVVAAAAPGTVEPGSRVDVVVTRDRGGTQLTLQDVPVLAVRGAPATDERAAGKIAATLRVPVQGAVELTAAGAFARELRLLARAPGDRSRLDVFPSS